MIYMLLNAGFVYEISQDCPRTGWALPQGNAWSDGWISSRDLTDFSTAVKFAERASELTEKTYVASDRGEHTCPRFDIVLAPCVGDEVSYAFNGDCYPDGTIVKISPTGQIKTSTGSVYRKSRKNPNLASWTKTGGTWSLVMGHHYCQNPEF